MLYITLFLSLLSASLIYNASYIFGIFFAILSLFFLFKEKNKKFIALFIIAFSTFFIFLFLKDLLFINSEYYLILERKSSYVICFNGLDSFYLKVDKESAFDTFDIIKVEKYTIKSIDFTVLESGFDFNQYLFSKDVDHQIEASKITSVFNFPLSFFILKENFLNGFENEIIRNFVSGFLFSSLDYSLEETYLIKDLQIITLFSLSGIYLNFILYGLKKIFFLKFSEKTSYILSFIVVFPFLFINISRFTTIKVIVFYIFNFINRIYLDRKFSRLEAIAIVGSFFIVLSNRIIFQAGFYMSFLIYTFLGLSGSKFNDLGYFEKKIALQLLLVFIVLPFNISFNNSFNIISFVFMMIFMLLSKVIFVFAILTFLFLPNFIIEEILKVVYRIIYACDSLKINIHIPEFNHLLYIIYFILLVLFLYLYEVNFKRKYHKVGFILSAILLIYTIPIDNYMSTQISFINIGQGDSTLIRVKNKAYLIDTGGLTYTDVALNNLIPYLKKNRIYSLEGVFITHDDYDHSGALTSLTNNFEVKNVYTQNNFDSFKDENLPLINLNNYVDLWGDDENEKSLVLYLDIYDKTFLFMGDASTNIEKRIILDYPSLDVDYLKVSHHGSKTASSLDFLKKITPEEAIISVGKNNWYNHPNDEVLANLKRVNAKIRRTDLEGTITYKFY